MANELGIGYSPLSEKIYLGKQNKAKRMWVGEKKDITDNFIDVMFEYLPLDEAREVVTANDNEEETKHFFMHFNNSKKSLNDALSFLSKELEKL